MPNHPIKEALRKFIDDGLARGHTFLDLQWAIEEELESLHIEIKDEEIKKRADREARVP